MFADMFYYNELNKCVIDLFVICYVFQLSNKDKIMLILILNHQTNGFSVYQLY